MIPTLSVVVCAYADNRLALLEACVEAVLAQLDSESDLIVVIDHNPDLLARIAGRYGARAKVVANTHQQGLSGARNTGVEMTSGEVVAFVDDDAEIQPGWLTRMRAHYTDPTVAAVGGWAVPVWPASRPSWFPREFDWVVGCSHRGLPTTIAPVRNVLGCNMSFRRTALERTGGFSTALGRVGTKPVGCEETEVCIRVRQSDPDAQIILDPAIQVRHSVSDDRTTLSYFRRRCYAEGQSKRRLSSMVGSGDALQSERQYVRRVLPTGFLAALAGGHLRRCAALVLGLFATTLGYLVEAVRPSGRTAEGGPVRVAMVCARALPLMGGVETHVHEVATRLAATGAEVQVLTTDRTGELPATEQRDGYRIRRWRAYPRTRDYYLSPGLVWHLIRARGRYDVVHVQGVHTLVAPMALAAARGAGLPAVLTFHTGGHSSPLRGRLRPLQWRLLAPLLRSARTLVAVSEHERDLFAPVLGAAGTPIDVIRNGAEPLPVDPAAVGPTGAPLLLSVGRLERYKGHHRILRAMPQILAQAPEAHLALVGSGPYADELRAMASDLGVAEHVSFCSFGPDRRGALGKLMSEADVVCLLSEYEAHPVAIMEAVGAGSKALVADTSGLSELGRAGLATVIDLEAPPEEVAAAALAVAAAPRVTDQTVPSWAGCVEQLNAVYRQARA